MERVIAIFAMIMGVISFTFVVSNINSIISQQKKKQAHQQKNLMYLNRIHEKHGLSKELIKTTKNIIFKNIQVCRIENVDDFFKVYPKSIKTELQLSMYKENMSQIEFFQDLPDEIMITIGRALKPISFTPSTISTLFPY